MNKYKYGAWAEQAKKNDWHKFFRAIDRGMLGCLGDSWQPYDYRQLYSFELTTKKGYRNSLAEMRHDFKMLKQRLMRMGYDLEHVAVPEISPKNELFHFHGIFRWVNWDGKKNQLIDWADLSEIWNEIHGAWNVRLRAINGARFMREKVRYACKHAFKEYPDMSKCGMRVSTSKGWLPKNTENVHRIMKRAGNISIMKAESKEEREKIWNRIDRNFLNWAGGKPTVPMSIVENAVFYIKNQKVYVIEGGEYETEEFCRLTGITK
jgi:hypothetical protein